MATSEYLRGHGTHDPINQNESLIGPAALMTPAAIFAIRRRMESPRAESCPSSCPTCGSWWRLPLLLGLVLAAIMLSRGCGLWEVQQKTGDGAAHESADEATREKVSLSIDFGNGRRQDFAALAWHEGMTVAEVFGQAAGIAIAQKGTGPGTFLTTIDDVANEGADGSNWTYKVNGQSGDRSFAVVELRPGDRVLWTFGRRR